MKEFVAGVVAFAVGAGLATACLHEDAPKSTRTITPPPIVAVSSAVNHKLTPGIERLESVERALDSDLTWNQGAEWVFDGYSYPYFPAIEGAGDFDVAVPYVFETTPRTAQLRVDGHSPLSFELKPNGIPVPKLKTVTIKAGPYRVTYKPRPVFSPMLPLIYEVTASGPHRGMLYGVTLYRVASASESQEYSGVRCGTKPGLQVIPDWNTGQYTISVWEVRQDSVELKVDRKVFGNTTLFNLKAPDGRIVYTAKGDRRFGDLIDSVEDPDLGQIEWNGYRITCVDPIPIAWQYRRHESEPDASPYRLEDLKDGHVSRFTRFRSTSSPPATSAPFSLGLPPRKMFGDIH